MNTLQKQILNALMGETNESLIIFASWVADPATLRATPLGVSFEVNGFLHQGRVNVWYDPIADSYTVELSKAGQVTHTETGIQLNDLQRTVDYLVEYDPDNYESMIEAEAEKDPIFGMILNVKKNGGQVVIL